MELETARLPAMGRLSVRVAEWQRDGSESAATVPEPKLAAKALAQAGIGWLSGAGAEHSRPGAAQSGLEE